MDLERLVTSGEVAWAAGEGEVGGKALGLARLEREGARVPPWRVVGAAALEAHLAQAGLVPRLEEGLAELAPIASESPAGTPEFERVAEELQEAILSASVPEPVVEAVRAACAELGSGPFAVRSSMVGEDSVAHSFAGQLESYLSQQSPDEVLDSLRRCWASAFSPRALLYRFRIGETSLPRIGVVLQVMIAGEVSGVGFTAHPVTGRRDHVLLAATWGLGEGVVSGECSADEFVVDHTGQEVSASIADKGAAVVPAAGSGVETSEVSAERRQERCLSPEQASQLAREAARIASALGSPQDVEWTLAGGELYFLQARPITSLPPPPEPEGPLNVFDNSNVQESYCGVTTPLTFSFVAQVHGRIFTQTMRVLGIPEETVREHEPVVYNHFGLVRGRVYYNLRNWYRSLTLFPSYKKHKGDFEKLIGLEEIAELEEKRLPFLGRVRQKARLVVTLVKLLNQVRKLQGTLERFWAGYEVAYRRIDRATFGQATLSELMALLDQVDEEIIQRWQAPIINDLWLLMSTGRLRRLVEGSGVEDPEAMLLSLMGGQEGIASTAPTIHLVALAQEARGNPALSEALRAGSTAEAFERLRAEHPEFFAGVADYIERFGDRVMGELKLETITVREDPSFVIEMLRNYLATPDLDPATLSSGEQAAYEEASAALLKRLGPLKRAMARWTIKSVRSVVFNRETSRLLRTRTFGLYRDLYRAVGDRLHEAGRLDEPRDVFYLSAREIEDYFRGQAVTTDLAPLARLRKAEFAAFELERLPNQIVTRGPVYHGNELTRARVSEAAKSSRSLQGTGCFPGIAEAVVRVVRNPKDATDLGGKILVAERTDPGWAPLFPTTSGLLIERGSTLSHSAVVARELRIPTVVGIPDLMDILEDGERVRLDGGSGQVERL